MQSVISNALIESIKPGSKPYEIRDSRLNGFLLRVQPSGVMTYYIEYACGRRIALGKASAIPPAMARDKAKSVLADVYLGNVPIALSGNGTPFTLRSFVDEVYSPWAKANIRTADATVASLKASFRELLETKLGDLTAFQVEKWRAGRHKSGVKPTTTNRDLDDLRSAHSHARTVRLRDVPHARRLASALDTTRHCRESRAGT